MFPQLDRGNHVAAIFFDLSKAFDTVPHHLLLAALQFNGNEDPILCWFQNYLSGRCQSCFRWCASDPHPVTSGVPQGSILGPLLFFIFMNSIFNIPSSHGSKIMVYADDIVLYKPITTDLDLTALQNDIVSVDSWAKANSLKLNVMKTKAVTFSRKRHTPTFCLSLNGSSIPIVTSLKLLGVTLSNNLSWSEHINNICLRSKR